MDQEERTFSNKPVDGVIQFISNKDIRLKCRISEKVTDNVVNVIAASPPEFRSSYSGSGLPFSSPVQAFDNTPNKMTVVLKNNEFVVDLYMPNSYYAGLGSVVIPPTVYVSYNNGYADKVVSIKVSDSIPYRLLSYPAEMTAPRKNAEFYSNHFNLPVRTQEQILRDAGYPENNKMHSNFWGLKPSL